MQGVGCKVSNCRMKENARWGCAGSTTRLECPSNVLRDCQGRLHYGFVRSKTEVAWTCRPVNPRLLLALPSPALTSRYRHVCIPIHSRQGSRMVLIAVVLVAGFYLVHRRQGNLGCRESLFHPTGGSIGRLPDREAPC